MILIWITGSQCLRFFGNTVVYGSAAPAHHDLGEWRPVEVPVADSEK
jgi:hypothetical protein